MLLFPRFSQSFNYSGLSSSVCLNLKRKFEGTRKHPRSQSCHILTAGFRQVGNDAEIGKLFAYKLGLKTGRENSYSHFSDTQNCGFCEIFKL